MHQIVYQLTNKFWSIWELFTRQSIHNRINMRILEQPHRHVVVEIVRNTLPYRLIVQVPIRRYIHHGAHLVSIHAEAAFAEAMLEAGFECFFSDGPELGSAKAARFKCLHNDYHRSQLKLLLMFSDSPLLHLHCEDG